MIRHSLPVHFEARYTVVGAYMVPAWNKSVAREARENSTTTAAQQQHSGTVTTACFCCSSFSGCVLQKYWGLCLAIVVSYQTSISILCIICYAYTSCPPLLLLLLLPLLLLRAVCPTSNAGRKRVCCTLLRFTVRRFRRVWRCRCSARCCGTLTKAPHIPGINTSSWCHRYV